jgi:hypothetical protein
MAIISGQKNSMESGLFGIRNARFLENMAGKKKRRIRKRKGKINEEKINHLQLHLRQAGNLIRPPELHQPHFPDN